MFPRSPSASLLGNIDILLEPFVLGEEQSEARAQIRRFWTSSADVTQFVQPCKHRAGGDCRRTFDSGDRSERQMRFPGHASVRRELTPKVSLRLVSVAHLPAPNLASPITAPTDWSMRSRMESPAATMRSTSGEARSPYPESCLNELRKLPVELWISSHGCCPRRPMRFAVLWIARLNSWSNVAISSPPVFW